MPRLHVRRAIWFSCELKGLLNSETLTEKGWSALRPLLATLNLPEPVQREDPIIYTYTTGGAPHTSDGAVVELLYAVIPPSVMCDPRRVCEAIYRLLRDPTSFAIPRRIRAMQRRKEFRAVAKKAGCTESELLACFCKWIIMRGHETQIITGDAFAGSSHVYRSYPPLWTER